MTMQIKARRQGWIVAGLLLMAAQGAQSQVTSSTLQNELYLTKQRIDKDPKDAEGWAALGTLYLKTNSYKAALLALEKAKDLNPQGVSWRGPLAEYYLASRQYDKIFDAGLGDSAQVREAQGFALIEQGSYDRARVIFEQLRRQFPASTGAWTGIQKSYLAAGDLGRAMRELNAARQAGVSDSARGLLVQGELLEEQQKPQEAQQAYQQALALEPMNPFVMKSLLRLVYALGDKAALINYSHQFYQALPAHPEAMYYYALGCIENDQLEKGVSLLSTLVKALPEFSGAKLALGRLAFGEGRWKDAQASMESMETLNPSAKVIYAGVLLKLGDYTKAESLLKSLAPAENDMRSYGLLTEVALHARESDAALQRLDRALDMLKDRASWTTALNLMTYKDGESPALVADQMNHLFAQSQAFIPFDLMHLRLAIRDKQWKNASVLAEQAAKNRPDEPVVYYLMGQIYANLGKRDDAIVVYQKAASLNQQFAGVRQAHLQELLAQKAWDKADALAQALQDKHPKSVDGFLAKAQVREAQNSLEEAKALRSQALEQSPNSVKAQSAMLEHTLRHENIQAANDYLEKNPGNLHLTLVAKEVKGMMAMAAGKHDKVIDFLAPIVRHDSPIEQKLGLATAYVRTKNLEKARVWARRLDKKPEISVPVGLLKAEIALEEKSYDNVLKTLYTISEFAPDNPEVYRLKGLAYLGLGQAQQANQHLEQAYTKAATQENCMLYLKALSSSGTLDQAALVANNWLKMHPDDDNIRLMAIDIAKERGNTDEAVAHYEVMLNARPDDLTLLGTLVDLTSKGQREKSLIYAKRAYALSRDPLVADRYGWALLLNDKRPESLEVIQEALIKLPESPLVHYHYAVIQKRLGHLDKAKQHLEIALTGKNFVQRQQAQALLEAIDLGHIMK